METITTDDLKELAEDLKKEALKPSKEGEGEQKSTYLASDRKRLQNALLRQTINLAFGEVPYYKEIAESSHLNPLSIRNVKDLGKLPPLEGKVVREEPNTLVTKSKVDSIVTVNQSSGTTGRPIRIYLSRDELDALRYYNDIMSIYVGAHKHRISLVLGDWNPILYGTLNDFMISSHLLSTPKRRFDRVIDDILYEHDLPGIDPRVSILYLDSTRIVRMLTEEMLAKGVDPLSTSVRDIWILEAVSESSRKWIMSTWKAKVHSLYSLTECVGGAMQCEGGNYHFDIRLIPEIVDTLTLQPTKKGFEGKLLITTLSPFQQTMPLLRYSTNDIAIRGPDDCICGERGLTISRVLGKADHCVYLGDVVGERCEKRWLGYTEVKDLLEEFPEYFVIDGYGAPVLKFKQKILHQRAKVKMTIGLNRKMASEKKQAQRVVSEGIYRVFPRWRQWLDSGRMDFQIELRAVSNIINPRTLGFLPQH